MNVDDVVQNEVDGEVDGLHRVTYRRDQIVPVVRQVGLIVLTEKDNQRHRF